MSTKTEDESFDSGSRGNEYESATERINNALQKIRSELSEIRDQDLKLLKQLIQISETIKRLSEDRLSKRRTWYGQRQSLCSESAELYLDVEPLTPDLDDYREAILVREFNESVSFSRDDLLGMRTNLSIFDAPIALDSNSTMDQSWPPNLSRVQLRHRPHSVSVLASSRSYGMDSSQEWMEDSDKSYEEILQRNVRLWKGRQSVHACDDEEEGARTPVNDWSFFTANGRRSPVSLAEVNNASKKRNSDSGSSSSSSIINSSGSSYSSSAVDGGSSRSSSSSCVYSGVNVGVGETIVPDVGVGETIVPDVGVGETIVPDVGVGETIVPDVGVGETIVPDVVVGETIVPDVVDNSFSGVGNTVAENSSINSTSVAEPADNNVTLSNVDGHCSGDVYDFWDTKKCSEGGNDEQSVGDDENQTPVIEIGEPVNEWMQSDSERNGEERSDKGAERAGEFEMRVPEGKERGILRDIERVGAETAGGVREGAAQIRGGACGIASTSGAGEEIESQEEGPEVGMMEERERESERGGIICLTGAGRQMTREEEKAVGGGGWGGGSREGEKERGRDRGKDGRGGYKPKGKESSGSSGGGVVRALLDHIGRKIENRVTVGMAEYSRSFLPVISEISKRDDRQKASAHRPRELDIT